MNIERPKCDSSGGAEGHGHPRSPPPPLVLALSQQIRMKIVRQNQSIVNKGGVVLLPHRKGMEKMEGKSEKEKEGLTVYLTLHQYFKLNLLLYPGGRIREIHLISKMAENTLFFCLHVNWPFLPRFKAKYSFEFCRWDRGNKGQLTMRQKSNVFSAILE